MLLSTPAYFAFLAIAFFLFWPADRWRQAGLGVILFANYFFYARWDLAYLAIIPLSSTTDFFIGFALNRTEAPRLRKLLVLSSVILNTSLIVALRYAALPLGLSFYAFQSLTYTIDIYRRDASPAPNYLSYLAAASFFPCTLAGPIARMSNLIGQISRDRIVNAREGGAAIFLICAGLTKKLLIADYLAENLIDRVFDTPKLYSALEVLTAVYGYAFQLYYDFSGYTDIALGSALLLGIRLPANFNQPYIAANIADFWRRWHITLSNWLRDYLYFSLPGLRSPWKVFAYSNLVITMAIGGLWHGASWTFLAWGLIHGLGLAFVRWLESVRKAQRTLVPKSIAVLATFHFVAFAWIFFRAPSLAAARDILGQIASMTTARTNISPGFAVVLAIAVAVHYLPADRYSQIRNRFETSPFYVQAGAAAALVLAIQYVAATGAAPFIYTRF